MMQDDPPEDEPNESQSQSCDDDESDAVEISGVEIEVGNTDGEDSNEEEDPPQRLVLGDSLAGDIESIVASDNSVDEALASDKRTNSEGGVECVWANNFEPDPSSEEWIEFDCNPDHSQAGGFLDAEESKSESSDASGIIEDDIGIIYCGERRDVSSVINPLGGLSLEGGEVKAWDVDLGEFLKDVEDDPDAATMLGAANEFDPDAGDSLQDEPEESQSESCDIYENDVLFQGQGIEDSPSKGILNEAINELISLGFYGFILIVICAIFLICMFLGYV